MKPVLSCLRFEKGPNYIATVFGWSPGLRALATGRVLPCGCIVGRYDTWSGRVIEVVDLAVDTCADGHRANLILSTGRARQTASPGLSIERAAQLTVGGGDDSFGPDGVAPPGRACGYGS
jgi:hypothetical protein